MVYGATLIHPTIYATYEFVSCIALKLYLPTTRNPDFHL